MSYNIILKEIYEEVQNNDINQIKNSQLKNYIKIIADKSFQQKGVYTVLVTLLVYKLKHPSQDIRYHQTQLKNGFSGRTIDTKYITPTLKLLELPSMAESGWLTRSLEQPYPYTLDYNGKISQQQVKEAFLAIIDYVQEKEYNPKDILKELLKEVIKVKEKNKVKIKPLKNPDKLSINKIIEILIQQFSFNYKIHGGSKLPVLAFYSIYKILLSEMSRYQGCELKELNSHTTSDRTSNSSGDIEIFKNNEIFEAVEIKLDKEIDTTIVRIAREKIIKHNPKRYYILSSKEIQNDDLEKINEIIKEIKENHGCQLVVNGLIPSLKYYLRLITNAEDFINIYSNLIEKDTELKFIHKTKWNEFIEKI